MSYIIIKLFFISNLEVNITVFATCKLQEHKNSVDKMMSIKILILLMEPSKRSFIVSLKDGKPLVICNRTRLVREHVRVLFHPWLEIDLYYWMKIYVGLNMWILKLCYTFMYQHKYLYGIAYIEPSLCSELYPKHCTRGKFRSPGH